MGCSYRRIKQYIYDAIHDVYGRFSTEYFHNFYFGFFVMDPCEQFTLEKENIRAFLKNESSNFSILNSVFSDSLIFTDDRTIQVLLAWIAPIFSSRLGRVSTFTEAKRSNNSVDMIDEFDFLL